MEEVFCQCCSAVVDRKRMSDILADYLDQNLAKRHLLAARTKVVHTGSS